jgi:hypothetical protein
MSVIKDMEYEMKDQFRKDFSEAYLDRFDPKTVEIMWMAYCHGFAAGGRDAIGRVRR